MPLQGMVPCGRLARDFGAAGFRLPEFARKPQGEGCFARLEPVGEGLRPRRSGPATAR